MDIQEIKNFAKNKIEADNLAKQVRRRIKETAWEKQNQREGFSETFKPLISQFEKPEDSKKENIFTQNQEMLGNQLALTEGLKANQKAITDGFSQFERLAEAKVFSYDLWEESPGNVLKQEIEQPKIGELIQFEDDSKTEKEKPKDDYFDLYERFEDKEIENLRKSGLMEPDNLLLNNKEVLKIYHKDIINKIRILHGQLVGIGNKKNKNQEDIDFLKEKNNERELLVKYNNTIADIIKAKEYYKSGQGIFFYSPQELIKRFELLGGSLAAGNNGVLHEYIQIAHRLKDLGIVTNKQLNKLLKNYLNIR